MSTRRMSMLSLLLHHLSVPLLLLLVSDSIISNSASTARTQQSLSAGLKVELRDVRAANVQRYKWRVDTETDKPVATFELSSSDALPGTVQQQIGYTMTATRARDELLHVLSGTLVLSNPTKSNIWVDKPTVSVQPTSGRRQSAATFKCPALVRAQGQATCRFSAQWHTNKHPRSGLVAATVTISDSNKAVASKAVPFNFADAVQQTVGESARISSEWEPARGDVLLPKGTSGTEPPKNLLLAQGRKFKFSAVFKPDPYKLELCGRPWRAIHYARLTPTGSSPGKMAPNDAQVDKTVVTLTFSGCPKGSRPLPSVPVVPASAPASSSNTDSRPPPLSNNVDTRPPAANSNGGGGSVKPQTPITPAVVPSVTPTPTVTTPTAPSMYPGGNTVPAVPAVPPVVQPVVPPVVYPTNNARYCAGTQQWCAEGSLCLEGTTCCPSTSMCGTLCCQPPSACINGVCTQPCGSGPPCTAGKVCVGDGLCCYATEFKCGVGCCAQGKRCVEDRLCLDPDQVPCGPAICRPPAQQCVDPVNGVCCSPGAGPVCGLPPSLYCCPTGQVCNNYVCSAPPPPSPSPAPWLVCGSITCPVGTTCSDSTTGTCCDIRSTTPCGTQCCVLATQVCNFITKTCADRVNPACPAQWCPLAPGGPVCCSSQSPPAGFTFQCQGSMGCQLVQTTSPQTVCGGFICAPGTTCVGGMCCSPANQCGSTCCLPPSRCDATRSACFVVAPGLAAPSSPISRPP